MCKRKLETDQTVDPNSFGFFLTLHKKTTCQETEWELSSQVGFYFSFLFLKIRNRLNQEQNSKLQQQKELLNKRNMEVAMMDKRINELRERLYKKKVEARQKENIPVR